MESGFRRLHHAPRGKNKVHYPPPHTSIVHNIDHLVSLQFDVMASPFAVFDVDRGRFLSFARVHWGGRHSISSSHAIK